MTPERRQKIDTLFHDALSRPADERSTYLFDACPDDQMLREEVQSLLEAHQRSSAGAESQTLDTGGGAIAAGDAFSPGQVLDHYKVLSVLGVGGMGVVYSAEDIRLGRRVAIKILPRQFTQNKDRIRRFAQEARTASGLNHPNIVTIYDISETGEGHFIVMELVEGRTLRGLATGPAPLQSVISWGKQAARALAAAHTAGVVHRDIKPDNIMVREDGYVKVLDFGLARLTTALTDGGEGETRTKSSALVGTVAYMSPEQARGKPVTSATDVFSLGIVLYQLATGEHPFPADSVLERLNAITSSPPQPPSLPNPLVPPEMEQLILQMLQKEPQLRPSAVQVAEALECMVLLEMGRGSKPNLPAPPAPKRKRRAWPVAAAGALAALCILGVWLYSRFIRSDTLGPAQPGAIDFIREFGTPGWDVVSGLAVAGGTVYVSGDTYGALEGAATGQPDAFLRQYSSHGDVRWTRQFSNGPGSQTHAQDVVATMSGVYVGGSGKEAYLRRYNSFGAEIWKHPLGENVFPADLAGDAGLVYIAGQACCYDAWVAKFDASGKELWTRKFGTEADDTARALIVHHGAVHVVGHITGAMPGQTSAGGVDAVLRKFDLDGNVLWTRQFGTPGFDEATGVAADAKWIYVVGNTTGALTAQKNAGERDVFVRKYDPEGNEVWTRQFGSPKYDDATAAALDATGIYVVGNTEGNLLGQKSAGQVDMFVVHFDPNGNFSWVRQIGSSGSDFATRIKVEIGGIYLAGHTDGALPGQTNQGSYDAFLLKLPPTAAAVKAGSENRPK